MVTGLKLNSQPTLSLQQVQEFIQTFDFCEAPIQQEELGSPVTLWNCMHEIYPAWFDDSIHPSQYENDKEAYVELIHYLSEYHEGRLDDDFNVISNRLDELRAGLESLVILIHEIIILSALATDDVAKYINRIITLNKETQRAIKELITNNRQGNNSIDNWPFVTPNAPSTVSTPMANDNRVGECNTSNPDPKFEAVTILRDQLRKAEEERQEALDLIAKKRQEESETKRRLDEANKNIAQLKKEAADNHERLSEEYDAKLQQQTKELAAEQLKLKSIQEMHLAEKTRLKEQIEDLQHEAQEAKSLEIQVKSMREKLDELSTLRNNFKILDDRYKEHMEKCQKPSQDIDKSEEMNKAIKYKKLLKAEQAGLAALQLQLDAKNNALDKMNRQYDECLQKIRVLEDQISEMKKNAEQSSNQNDVTRNTLEIFTSGVVAQLTSNNTASQDIKTNQPLALDAIKEDYERHEKIVERQQRLLVGTLHRLGVEFLRVKCLNDQLREENELLRQAIQATTTFAGQSKRKNES